MHYINIVGLVLMLSQCYLKKMNTTHENDQLLYKIVLRMPKATSSFFYFALESNENISFYSTLPLEKGQSHRDIEIFSTPELKSHLKGLISHYQDTCQFETLEESMIKDL